MSQLRVVAAAILIDDRDRVLLCQRPQGKPWAGYWEFPGGKLHAGEPPEQALIRELHEELGITVAPDALAPWTFASHPYPDFHLLMVLYSCRTWDGEVQSLEGQAMQWCNVDDLKSFPLLPADAPLLPGLARLLAV